MKMMKYVLPFVMLTALAACNQQSSGVSYEQFKKAAESVEPHQYQTAKVTLTAITRQTGAEDIEEQVEIDYTWDAASEEWTTTTQSTDAQQAKAYLTYTAAIVAENYKGGKGAKFYLNPMKIVTSQSQSQSGTTVSITATMVFDQYGYISDINVKTTMKASSGGQSVSITNISDLAIAFAD